MFGNVSYQINGSEIVVSAKAYDQNSRGDESMGSINIRFNLLSDGTLKVVAISGAPIHEIAGIKVGSIFYPTAEW